MKIAETIGISTFWYSEGRIKTVPLQFESFTRCQNGRLLYFGFLVEIQEAFFWKVLVYQGFPVLEGALTNVKIEKSLLIQSHGPSFLVSSSPHTRL